MVIKESGVYQIRNIINNKRYIGSAVDLNKRWLAHKRDLRKNCHVNDILQRAWNKYKERAFVFEILELVLQDFLSKSEFRTPLLAREQYYKDLYKSYDRKYGYDICSVAGAPMLGREFTKEHCERISKALSGVKKSLEHNKAVSASLLGHRHSEETRRKISETRKREKIGYGRNNPFYGRKHSEESREKMSIALRSKNSG